VTGRRSRIAQRLLHTAPLSGGTATPPPAPAQRLVNGGLRDRRRPAGTQSDPAIIGTTGRVRSAAGRPGSAGYDGARDELAQTVTVPRAGRAHVTGGSSVVRVGGDRPTSSQYVRFTAPAALLARSGASNTVTPVRHW
jgi:hypothetical protein